MKTPSYLALVFLMVVAVGASLAVHARSAVRSPDDTGGWMLDGLTLQRVSSSYDAREWVYLVHFNVCFEAGSGKAPAVLRVPVKFDGSVPPGAIDPALFCPVAHTLHPGEGAPPGSIIRQ